MAKCAAIFTVLLVILVGTFFVGIKAECDDKNDLAHVVSFCWNEVDNQAPPKETSKDCCNAINEVDIYCVCKKIDHAMEVFISMDKLMAALQYCGKPLSSGFHCGTYTVPSPPPPARLV